MTNTILIGTERSSNRQDHIFQIFTQSIDAIDVTSVTPKGGRGSLAQSEISLSE